MAGQEDVRRLSCYHKDRISQLDGWLAFIGSDKPEDILWLIEKYPEFEAVYREVFCFRYQMEELVSMYSEALQVLDANTVKYMVERQQEEIAKQKNQIAQQEGKIAQQEDEIESLKKAQEHKDAEIARLQALLDKR